jgi:hypothetical protein
MRALTSAPHATTCAPPRPIGERGLKATSRSRPASLSPREALSAVVLPRTRVEPGLGTLRNFDAAQLKQQSEVIPGRPMVGYQAVFKPEDVNVLHRVCLAHS